MTDSSLILFILGFLVLASILASRVSDRLGVPSLVVFLAVGMLAGSDGPGGIVFDNASQANMVGTIALAFILFSGGLDTNWRIIRPVLGRGVVLATGGVIVTAGLVGLFAWLVMDFPLWTGLLLGAIVSSTDAAAVFSVLRGRGVGLKGNLKPLLELESGSNDPMAVFLTLGITQYLTSADTSGTFLILSLFLNMSLGAAVGIASGKAAGLIFNKIRLDYEGLYPVLSMSVVLLTFGAAELIKGNGFLAVYICGVMLNGTNYAHKRYTTKFHDGLAWLMQILMFLVLGLLVNPSQLPAVAGSGLLAAACLMFFARPVAILLGLWKSDFTRAERLLVAWTGLRGAVPIVLATFPLLAGYEHSILLFDVVFFIVLTSVLVQGTLLMPVARWLKVDQPLASRPKFSLEIERQGQTQGHTMEVEILPNMAAAGKAIADLDIPPEALILLIGRGDDYVVPRGNTIIEPFDTLLMIGKESVLKQASDILVSPPRAVKKPRTAMDPLSILPDSVDSSFLTGHVVIVGYGRVGRKVAALLASRGIRYVVADENRAIVDKLREEGVAAVCGNAATAMVLAQAHVARASLLIIATPDTLRVRQMAEIARTLNPAIEIVVRTHSEMESSLLDQEQVGKIFLGEHELANSIVRYVVSRLGGNAQKTDA